ncbi:hypothetical protein [Butyricimonas paravirosa]
MKIKNITISSIILSALILFNVYLSLNISSLAHISLFNTEALADGENTGGNKTYLQITAGCRNRQLSNWVNRCCEGSSPSCTRQRCNYQIVDGCEKWGLRDISY